MMDELTRAQAASGAALGPGRPVDPQRPANRTPLLWLQAAYPGSAPLDGPPSQGFGVGMPLEVISGMNAIAIPIRFPVGMPWRRASFAFASGAGMELGSVKSFEPACVVPDDPGEVVRGARPISSQDRERMREQHISRMMADYHRQKSEIPAFHVRSA